MILNSWGLNGSRRSAGGLTTKVLKGQTIASQKRAKGQSNPSPQYLQSQAAAAIIVGIFQKIGSLIKQGYTSKKSTESYYNAFYAYTYLNALDLSSPPAASLTPADLLVTKGHMTPTPFASTPTAVSGTNTLTVHWNSTIISPGQDTFDNALVAAYNITQNKWFYTTANEARFDNVTYNITTPAGFIVAGNQIVVYLGFASLDILNPNYGTSSNSVNSTVVAS